HDSVWRFLRRLGGPDAADDLAGEVFCVALDRLGSYDPGRGSERAWLYGIAVNLNRGRARSGRSRRRAVERLAGARLQPGLDPAAHVIEREQRRVTRERVREAVASLPDEQREVLVLSAWEELPYAEIATVLDIPVGTVRSRLSRARATLRQSLQSPRSSTIETRPT
ncbi:MAG TPA: RNA polymerase sigma factor, partial [Acidimicrobiales bacterium]|nr:RNA polymerase sigma factor [Acidimicrobiales bacterium]